MLYEKMFNVCVTELTSLPFHSLTFPLAITIISGFSTIASEAMMKESPNSLKKVTFLVVLLMNMEQCYYSIYCL